MDPEFLKVEDVLLLHEELLARHAGAVAHRASKRRARRAPAGASSAQLAHPKGPTLSMLGELLGAFDRYRRLNAVRIDGGSFVYRSYLDRLRVGTELGRAEVPGR